MALFIIDLHISRTGLKELAGQEGLEHQGQLQGLEQGQGKGKRQGQGIGLKKMLEELEEGMGQEKEAEGYYYERYNFVSCRFSF